MYEVMIVDDEKAIRESLPHVIPFERYGFKVCGTAKNGEDALEKLELLEPDVVLLDASMPVLDGIGFLRKLHETEGGRIPHVIMLSGYSDFEYARTAVRYGVKAYLTKPMDEEEMIEVLTELKEELDAMFQKQNREKILADAKALQKMYHVGDGNREAYREYLLLHCVILKSGADEDAYSVVRECIEEKVGENEITLFRSKGSVLSYLILKKVVEEEYQHSMTLFARHILYHMKKCGVECALLLDENLFEDRESTFRNDYATHLYRMLTEVFWSRTQIVENRSGFADGSSDCRLEQEDLYLAELKAGIAEREESRMKEAYRRIVEEVEKKRLNLIFVQEINYRIYYALMDLMQKESAEQGEPVPVPLDWRDASRFVCHEEWREMLWGQVCAVFSYMETIGQEKHSGSGDKITAYLKAHFREQLSLTEVADRFYVSAAYLGRCIQKETGVGFKQYLNDLRMEDAKRLLCQTDMKIYEIAEAVGFRESKYFVSKFTAETGKSPLEYRRMNQK